MPKDLYRSVIGAENQLTKTKLQIRNHTEITSILLQCIKYFYEDFFKKPQIKTIPFSPQLDKKNIFLSLVFLIFLIKNTPGSSYMTSAFLTKIPLN